MKKNSIEEENNNFKNKIHKNLDIKKSIKRKYSRKKA